MQIRHSAKRWNLDIKTSSPDTQSLTLHMPECVNYSRKWLRLGNKYFLTSTSTSTSTQQLYLSTDYRLSTSTSTQYNKTERQINKKPSCR